MSIIDYFRPRSKAMLLRGEVVTWIERNARRDYIRQVVLSFPDWVNTRQLRMVWEECRRLERETGEKHHISHIIPLNHPYVCGLSVPWNLRALPWRTNLNQSNCWNPDQCELVYGGQDECEQLSLLEEA